MLDISRDIRSLTEFKRRSAAMMKQIKKSGRPLVLTVNGKAEVVVQDAASYQRLLERLEKAEVVAAIREGIRDAEAGRVHDARGGLKKLGRELEPSR